MNRKRRKYLHDILKSIQDIKESHLRGIHSQGAYNSASLTIQRAVERELQIIGEAASRLRKMGVELETTDQLINRRNTIVHQYDSFQPRTIWNFITYQMPLIQKEVEEFLKD